MSKNLPTENKQCLPSQEVIDIFKLAFHKELYEQDIEKLLYEVQQVKEKLFNREYIDAFSDDVKRVAYVTRWSPSRAISYSSLFCHFDEILQVINNDNDTRILNIGGGAGAELLANLSIFTQDRYTVKPTKASKLRITLVDIADWGHVVDRLMGQINERWLYNGLTNQVEVNFQHEDILKTDLSTLCIAETDLITMLFTTNEIFKEDRAGSIRFLQKLNSQCRSGCKLLIVESAGSYSHITVGTKKFPIQFLIDTVLMGKRGTQEGEWDLIAEKDSLWYRCDPNLDYPVKLENMRFFYRLYSKK